MSIIVTISEHFDRSKKWFIIFWACFIGLIIWCIVSGNIVWATLLFLLMGWYMYYILRSEETVALTIQDIGLQVWSKIYNWNELVWFVVEYNNTTQQLHNIVILYTDHTHHIHSFVDTKENIVLFVQNLSSKISFQSWFEQSTLEKILRKIKM